MAIAGPIYVQAPALAPSRWGLIDAGDLVPESNPKFRNGIQFEPLGCAGPAKLSATECLPAGDPEVDPRDFGDNGVPLQTADPVILYNGFTCKAVGISDADMKARASAALAAGESTGLERAVWGLASTRLMDPDTEVLTGSAVPLVKGVGLLEEYVSDNYGGVPIFHAPRKVSSHAGEKQQVRWDGGKPVTTVGSRWSFGAYQNTDPDGAAAAVDTAWIVATGRVQIRRSDVAVRPANREQSFDRVNNTIFALAERTYVVSWECFRAAVLVSL